MNRRLLVNAHPLAVAIAFALACGGESAVAVVGVGEDATAGRWLGNDPPCIEISPPSDGLSNVSLDLIRQWRDGNIRAVKGVVLGGCGGSDFG